MLASRPRARRLGVPRRTMRRPWKDVEYCVIDLETTGLDVREDQIVSYGAVLVRGGRILARTATYGLVRPTRPIPPRAVQIHALRSEDLDGAAPLSSCVEALTEMLTDRVLVAHAAWIESGFLRRVFSTRDVRLRSPVVDTAALARATGTANAAVGREPSLEGLAGTLELPIHTPHHALGDALTTAEVLLALATRLGDGDSPVTAQQLVRTTRRFGVSAT